MRNVVALARRWAWGSKPEVIQGRITWKRKDPNYGFSASPHPVHVSTANQYFSLVPPMSDIILSNYLTPPKVSAFGTFIASTVIKMASKCNFNSGKQGSRLD